jgi:DNA modification methylase
MAMRVSDNPKGGAAPLTVIGRSNQFVVEEFAIDDLTPNPAPQRKHSERKLTRLAGSIQAFGQLPILVTDALVVLDGHAVLDACRRLGRTTVSAIRVSHLSGNAQRAMMMAINKLVEDAKWDVGVLKVDFEILLADPQIDFSLDITGFDSTFVDQTLLGPEPMAEDELPQPPETPVTQLGDLWRCGDHLIICGDSRDPNYVTRVMAGILAGLLLGDVPYNVEIEGNVSGLGKHQHGEFAMASGEMTREAFVEFQRVVFKLCQEASKDGALAYFFIDWRHVRDQIEAGEAVFGSLKQMVVWVKGNAGMGAFYRSQHELITIWKNGTAPHVNNFGLGASGRYRSNVFNYPGMSSFGQGRDQALASHPTVKPLALIVDVILDVTGRGDSVLDPFGGSGTTLIAAERTGRRAHLIEIDPKYVDVTLERFINETGEQPLLDETGETYAAVAERRGAEAASEWDIV